MQTKTFFVISLLTLAVLWWVCLQFIFVFGPEAVKRAIQSTERVVFVTSSNLESEPGIRVLDANNPFFEVLRQEPNRIDVKWEDTKIESEEATCRLKKSDGPLVRVMARLNGRQYPMVIDSGCGLNLVVNDVVVKEHQLEIFPFEFPDSTLAGFCRVDKLEIGNMTISNPPCAYTLNHYEKRVLGRTKWKERQILFGLGLLHRFRYFLIDNVASEVEFGMRESFQADPLYMWGQYRMSIETTKRNARNLMIHTTIAGEETKARLDTGTNWSLALSQNVWSKLSTELHVLNESRGQARFFHGWNDINTITVAELSVGDKCMTNTPIVVLNDTVFGENFILIGMDYFKDTVIVIDFEHSLLWVRKPEPL